MTIEAVEPTEYARAVAPRDLIVQEDSLRFEGGTLFPLAVAGATLPGQAAAWQGLNASFFHSAGLPLVSSLTVMRQMPDTFKRSMRARRTLTEGLLGALSERTGRRPSMAERQQDQLMDAAESAAALGHPIYRLNLLSTLFAPPGMEELGENARRTLESQIRARGLRPQTLYYIPDEALWALQPGGELFPVPDPPLMLLDEVLSLLPQPSRAVEPAEDAVWLGRHARDGRDVYFSFTRGLDPTAPPPPHATVLILGEQGSGKTSLARLMLLQRWLAGRTVVSLDPEGENSELCAALGGTVVPAVVPSDREVCLLHPLQGRDPAEIVMGARFLLAALEGGAALAPEVDSALQEAIRRHQERRPGPMTLTQLIEALGWLGDVHATRAIALLRPYAAGGLLDGFFDRPRALLDVTPEPGSWINFDLSSLREENKGLVQAVLSWWMTQAVTIGRQPMDVFIDEGWRLLREGPFADLLDELGRRARKRGTAVVLITHLPEDLLSRPTSLSLASTAFLGRLAPDGAEAFFRTMGVPQGQAHSQAAQVSRLPPHTFLAAPAGGRGALFPLRVLLPPVWLQMWSLKGAAH